MTESEWIAACIKGDQSACKRLFDTHKDWLFAVCRRYLTNVVEAEDALQESFILIFKNLHTYNGQGSFKGWMRKIVVNCALGMIRKKKIIVISLSRMKQHPWIWNYCKNGYGRIALYD